MTDALVMMERKMPEGTNIPDENYDWSAKMAEECIVGSWATAQLSPVGNTNKQYNHPLLEKLQSLGVNEINIIIRAVDFRTNIALGEYVDTDTLQIHSLWIPVKNIYDIQVPLNSPAVCEKLQSLHEELENST